MYTWSVCTDVAYFKQLCSLKISELIGEREVCYLGLLAIGLVRSENERLPNSVDFLGFYHSQLVLLSPTRKTCWCGEGIRKLQLVDVSVPDIHVVFAKAPFTHFANCWQDTVPSKISIFYESGWQVSPVVGSKTCHPGSFQLLCVDLAPPGS